MGAFATLKMAQNEKWSGNCWNCLKLHTCAIWMITYWEWPTHFVEMGKWPTKPGDQSFKWWYTIPYAVNHQDNWFIVYVYGSIQTDIRRWTLRNNSDIVFAKRWEWMPHSTKILEIHIPTWTILAIFLRCQIQMCFLVQEGRFGEQMKPTNSGWWFGTMEFYDFPIILRISSSQLTFTPSFHHFAEG